MAFGFCGFVSGSIGLVFSLISRGGEIFLTTRRSIILLVIFWLAIPALAAIPAMEINGAQYWVRAYVEAISHFSTTGAMVSEHSSLPRSFLFWQAGLQWAGGYASIVMALLILAPLNMTAPGVHRSPFLTIEHGNVAGRAGFIAWSMLLVYGSASLAVLFILVMAGIDVFDAFLQVMGTVSTGGFISENGHFATGFGSFASWLASVTMIFGAVSFAVHWDVIRGRTNYLKDRETMGYLVTMVGAGLLIWLLGKPILPAVQSAISALTTTAIPMDDVGFTQLPEPFVMALILVGGAAVSTVGGVKIIRFMILFGQSKVELSRLSHPSSTGSVQFRQVTIDPQQMVGLWAYVLGYAAVIAFVSILLGLDGIKFGEASQLAIISISNAGPAYIPESGIAGDFSSLSDPVLLALGLVMAMGRIEILAALAILSPEFWRE